MEIVHHLHILIVALRDHLGEEGDAGVELAVALVVGHELEHGDEVVGQDEWRNGLAIAAEAEDDGNCLVTIYKSGHAAPRGLTDKLPGDHSGCSLGVVDIKTKIY